MTPIERAARAIAFGDYPDGAIDDVWENYIPDARAVLTAIRPPSDEMCHLPGIGRNAEPWEIWQAMIAAALTEGPE